jgi:glycosyltransferase involved in cell wall biosynthesis
MVELVVRRRRPKDPPLAEIGYTVSMGGFFYVHENHYELSKQILWLKNHPDVRTQMNKNGRKFAEKLYDRKKVSRKIRNDSVMILNRL